MKPSCQDELARCPSRRRRKADSDADRAAPFVHKFQTPRQKYVYDVNTRRIIRVSQIVWDVIDDLGRLSDGEIVARHRATGQGEAARAALDQIRDVQRDRGFFLAHRPGKVLPLKRDQVDRRLQRRQQLILNVTEKCNFRCTYCVFGGSYEGQRGHSKKAMTWETARAAIDEFLANSDPAHERTVSFYGGEPLLNLSLIRRCVAHAKAAPPGGKLVFSMTTNGSLLAGAAADFVAGENFLITVSLDGPSQLHDRHRKTRSGRTTWKKVLSNLKAFLAAHSEYLTNGHMQFNAVATPQTDLCQTQAFFGSCELFTDAMGMQVNVQKERSASSGLTPSDVLVKSAEALRKEFLGELGRGEFQSRHRSRSKWVQASLLQRPLIMFHKRKYLSPHLPEKMRFLNTCVPGERRTFVSVSGDYYACERVPQDASGLIGDVRGGMDAGKVLAMLERWHAARGDACRGCWCLSNCMVGCFANAGNEPSRQSMAEACAAHRAATHRLLVQYCQILEENPAAFDYSAEFSFQ